MAFGHPFGLGPCFGQPGLGSLRGPGEAYNSRTAMKSKKDGYGEKEKPGFLRVLTRRQKPGSRGGPEPVIDGQRARSFRAAPAAL